jgi:signal recognition particle receptor subunit beta
MVQINFAQKQINAKVVFYGPGMSGKTTNLEVVHQRAPDKNRGELTSISTDGDRTLFFDYMPLDLGTIAGMRTCFQMYTVPGQVYYNSTRKLVLQGVDGVIFVADSSPDAMEGNLESLRNLEQNLNEYGKSLKTLPHVIQFNKRDIPGALPVEQMMAELNPCGAPTFEAVAATGQGVFPTLKGLASLVLKSIQAECAGGGAQPSGLARTGFHQGAPQPAAGTVASTAPGARRAPEPSAPAGAPALDMAPRVPVSSPAAALRQTGFHPAAGAPSAGGNLAQTGLRPAPQGLSTPAAGETTSPSQLMRPASPPRSTRPTTPPARRPQASAPVASAPAAGAAPAGGRRSSTPAPAPRSGGGGALKTLAFVVGAAAIGAVVAHFVLNAL